MNSWQHFLLGSTPTAWCEMAVERLDLLLIDHAHCEKKAASTAMNLIYRYPQYPDLIHRLSCFAREEMRHFEKVLKLMTARGVTYTHLSPSRYAGELYKQVATVEHNRLVDTLLLAAFIEARSCERFSALLPYLDDELAKFYGGLLAAEARHFATYLKMARQFAPCDFDIDARVGALAEVENQLIQSPDEQFRFHSGCPVVQIQV
ncbi:MAG: tRNA-(ms[2]io[6]A)-hydroxylase [Coxiellaceae bacterium]|nr:tRNA-(ms[2]io[6]A)-hydroxylase [Coxiellaceae bacterium]